MKDETTRLILDVADGNPGAIRVIKELEWYSKWFEMLRWMKKHNLVGGEIWAKWKDEYKYDTSKMAHWLEEQMAKDREFRHFYYPTENKHIEPYSP